MYAKYILKKGWDEANGYVEKYLFIDSLLYSWIPQPSI